jgi:hypothetical protein
MAGDMCREGKKAASPADLLTKSRQAFPIELTSRVLALHLNWPDSISIPELKNM